MKKWLVAVQMVLIYMVFAISMGSAKESQQEALTDHAIYLPLEIKQIPHDWIGPDGGLISSVVVDPQDPANVYAGSWGGGVYKSVDGGTTWQRSSQGLNNLVIVSLAVDPVNPSTLYTGTYRDGVYKSNDGAATWTHVNNGIQDGAIVYSLVVDPANPVRLYAATRGISNEITRPWAGVVYRSEDGAVSWIPSLYNLGGSDYQDYVYFLEIDPNNPNIIFGATHEHGPVRSKDYGGSWKVLTNGISNWSTRAVVVDPRANKDIVYTGVWKKDGVFKSTDGGGWWQLMSAGITGANIYHMAIDPFTPSNVYAATFNMGVMKTSDGAVTWHPAGLGADSIATVRVSPADGQTVFAGTAGDGLYISRDAGQSWLHSQEQLKASSVTSLIVSPLDPNTYFSSVDGGGVARSQDLGASWSEFNNNLFDRVIYGLVKHPLKNTLYALTGSSGLYRCNLEELSLCWQKMDLNVFSNASPGASVMQANLPEFRTAFLREYSDPVNLDSALSPDAPATLFTMEFAPSDANTAYLGTKSAGLYRSSDGGLSWKPTAWTSQTVVSVAVDPKDPNVVYFATDKAGMIAFSNNGGATIQTIGFPDLYAYALAISSNQPETLLAGTNDGVYAYSSGIWEQIGLAGQNVQALAFSSANPDLIIAGTTNGAMLSADAGGTWFSGPEELNGITVQAISFSPNNPGLVFYHTAAHGTLRAEIEFPK